MPADPHDEGEPISFAEFTASLPLTCQAYEARAEAERAKDPKNWPTHRSLEDWLRELVAYEAYIRVSSHFRTLGIDLP